MSMVKRIRSVINKGDRFNRLVVVEYVDTTPNGKYYMFQCECGNITYSLIGNVTSGRKKSCGCYSKEIQKELHTKHGMTNTKLYRTWKHINRRCHSSYHPAYKDYGARGITVCKEWREFVNFYSDMIDMYNSHVCIYGESRTTLDRIDNNKGYSKENCRWIDQIGQANNTRRNIRVTYNGKEGTLAEFVRELGLRYEPIRKRLKRGWDIQRALSQPLPLL